MSRYGVTWQPTCQASQLCYSTQTSMIAISLTSGSCSLKLLRGSAGMQKMEKVSAMKSHVSSMNVVCCVSGEMASHRFVLFARSFL